MCMIDRWVAAKRFSSSKDLYMAGIGSDSGPPKRGDRPWSSYVSSHIKGLKSLLPGGGREKDTAPDVDDAPDEHDIFQTKPEATDSDIVKSWEKVQVSNLKDELETLKKDHAVGLLKITELERQVHVAERSARSKEDTIADLIKAQKLQSGRKGKHDVNGTQLIAKIDNFQKIEEQFKSDLQHKEEQRFQATQQVIALREELNSSRHHIENLQHKHKEMVDVNQKMEGEMKQLYEITPEDIPEYVDVRVLVSQLQARVSTLERENQQVKEHTKQQSKHIQIMKQREEGIKFHEGDFESLKGTCEELEKHNRALADQLKKIKEENQQLKSLVEAEQAQAATYKLDFEEEREDREKAHSRYTDLMAELKKEHIQEISKITKDLELHKGVLGDFEEVKFVLEKDLRDWQAEALQGRDDLQAKTSQVKAYKKQVDKLKEKFETQEQQILGDLSTTKIKKSELSPAPTKKGKSKTTEHKKKSTGEPPSPCGGLEQKLANVETLCDSLQTDNACLREAKRKSQLLEKALKEANNDLKDKVVNLERNLKDLRGYIEKKESEVEKLCNNTPSAVENLHLHSVQHLKVKDLNISAPPPMSNTLMDTSSSYPPSVHGQPSSMPSQSHTTSCDTSEQGLRSDGFGENSQSNAQFQQLHVQGNVRNVDENVYRDGNNYGQSHSPVASRGANDLVVPHQQLPNTTVYPQRNYPDHNLATQQQYNQGTHYPSNYSEPQQYPQQRPLQQQWHSQNQKLYYDGQRPDVYSQQRQDQYHTQDPQQQTWRSQGQQEYYEDQQPNVYNHQQQSQYEQSNTQSARRNLPIDLQGDQQPISHESYENTPTPVTSENASTYSSYGSARTSSDISMDVPSPTAQKKPKPKPRMLNHARQSELIEVGLVERVKEQALSNESEPRNVPASNHPSQWQICQPGRSYEQSQSQPHNNQQHDYQQTQQNWRYQSICLQQPQWQSKSKSNVGHSDGIIHVNMEKSAQVCEALEGGLADYQSLIKRLQDGVAAFQSDHEVLRKVTEERDRLLREIEYVTSDRDHLLRETAGQREIIQHEQKINEKKCTHLTEEIEKIRSECTKLLTSLKQCRKESEQSIAEVRGRCEQETNRRTQQERQAHRVFKQLDRRVKELIIVYLKGREVVRPSRPYSQEVKASIVNSKKSIQFSEQNRIGKGSFGSVYAVNLNGTLCIAKRLHDILMGRGKLEDVALQEKRAVHETFCRECILMRQAKHANVVKFIGVHFGKDEFDLTLFMERLHTDLEVYLSSTPDVPLPTKISILHDVSCGLLYLHEECSIIHRDLTAANILLTADNQAKIADLGVSRIFDRTFLQLSKIPGTLPYMPPEALKDSAKYDESLDVFSFGVLTLCVGIQMSPDLSWDHVPDDVHAKGEQEIFKRKMWIEMMEQKQPELISLVLWCLSDDPKSRPSTYCMNVTLQEMKHDL